MTSVAHYVKLTSLTHKHCKNQTNTALGLQNCLRILKVDIMKETLMGMMIKGFYTILTEKISSCNKHILVMVDHLTSWPIATATPDKEAITVANAIHKDLILHHGAPEILYLTMAKNSLMIP